MIDSTNIPNRLANEKSPYLLQHKYNPVNWYPWSDEAFNKAKSEDKPVFLSVGYSTCHWCHVMERESFEDTEVAELLNESFISVKVDREERPDIDAVYMRVCQALTGSGGWPMSIFMTPEREPFFAGTYFPKRSKYGMPGFIELLEIIKEHWENGREKLLSPVGDIIHALNEEDKQSEVSQQFTKQLFDRAYRSFSGSFDPKYGGFGHAPKFPAPHNLMFLMRYGIINGNDNALHMALTTLNQMYKGGLFDHIGGGFSRYSTDQKWLAPHFEKMLYDNAMLTIAYMEAYQLTGTELYKKVAESTLEYVMREMTDKSGGFYSAQDADSEGEEGKYYLFTPDEVKSVLGEEDGETYCRFFDITEKGNFEGKSIPNLIGNKDFADWGKRPDELGKKLYEYRLKRTKLHKDDKILTAWNALMICAFAKAYQATGRLKYLSCAENALKFIERNLTDSSFRLMVRFRDGEAKGAGFLDDYAFMAWACLALYEATYDIVFLTRSLHYAKQLQKLFKDPEAGGYFLYAGDSEKLISRPKEIYDGAMPSGNSVAGYVLARLSLLTGQEFGEEEQLEFLASKLSHYPPGYSMSLIAGMQKVYPSKELMCVIETYEELDAFKAKMRRIFIPNLTVLVKAEDNGEQLGRICGFTKDFVSKGRSAYYICENHACSEPVYDLDELIKKLKS